MSGLLTAHRLRAGRRRLPDRREERRRRRHLVREHVSRAAGSTTRTTTTATRSRSATTGRSTTPTSACSTSTSATAPATSACSSTSASAPRCARSRGTTPRPRGRRSSCGPDGAEETLVANAVVSAVGQLNRPNFPDIPGIETFDGVAFHSAQWDHDAPIDGARVAVIGTGASSVQFTPEIAPRAGELFVFQRTPAVDGPHARLPRRRPRRAALALRARARPTASGTASGCSGGWATARSRPCGSTPSGTRRTAP